MNKKISLSVFAAAMALMAGGSALAEAPTAELRVVGSLDVPDCTVTPDNGGIYDVGRISPSMIQPGTATTTLNPIAQNWTINCDGKTYLTFKVIDEQADSVSYSNAASGYFGLGSVNDSGKLGYFRVLMSDATVDGTPSSVMLTNSSSVNGSTSNYLYGGAYTMGWSNGSALTAGETFAATLTVTPTLAGSTTMNGPITSDTQLDGLLTLNFAFGL